MVEALDRDSNSGFDNYSSTNHDNPPNTVTLFYNQPFISKAKAQTCAQFTQARLIQLVQRTVVAPHKFIADEVEVNPVTT
ncbi:hypothetical protein KKI23_00125 [Patescibacteria group bacterium]|nr:hypothetical protein [Patescibacteria group bacterium]